MRKARQNTRAITDKESRLPQRKPGIAHWLLLGAGTIGAIGAVARWTANSSRGKSRQQATTDSAVDESMDNFLMAPLPQSVPAVAAQTVSTLSASIVTAAETQVPSVNPPIAEIATANNTFSAPSSAVPAASPFLQTANEAQPKGAKKKTSSVTRKRGKMSQQFDEALAHNALPTDGREGERLNNLEHEMGATSMSVNDTGGAANGPGSPASMQADGSPAKQALSTQAEGKMAVGEELRDREFPVPPQQTGAASQRLVVDQETMPDEGPRPGGAIGTMPGDRQSAGEMADIEDQRAKTPDLVQQQR